VLIDGRSLPDGERIETDLCIVGSGPAGVTVARELAASGLRVTVLESGGPARDPDADRLGAGESVGHPYVGLERTRVRGIGGTSLHWQLDVTGDEDWVARPLDPLDFEARPGVADSGWPFDASTLEPFYRRAQVIGQLGPFAYGPGDWPSETSMPFPLSGTEVVTNLVQRGGHTFGEYRDDLAGSATVRVIHNATVLRLVADDTMSRVGHAEIATSEGRAISVAARRFVLAAGGLDNARLLLLSGRPHQMSGLGNERDLVGRYFMERLSARAGVLLPTGRELLPQGGLYRSHVVDGTRIQGVLSLAPQVVRREELRNAMFWVRERPRSITAPGVGSVLSMYRIARRRPLHLGAIPAHVVRVARDLPDVTRTFLHYALRRPESAHDVFQIGVQAEQAPNRESRVALGTRRDPFGQPVACLDWRPTDADRDSIGRSVEILDGALRRARLGRMIHKIGGEVPAPLFVGNWHHMGTTRMDPDPARGVVDPASRVHSLSNLYVAGSSVFPTSGYANPTLTIVALAVRLADELRAGAWGETSS
jgi:choline dehydrogenase-like flavoprotein